MPYSNPPQITSFSKPKRSRRTKKEIARDALLARFMNDEISGKEYKKQLKLL